jgi:hypothetical protein
MAKPAYPAGEAGFLRLLGLAILDLDTNAPPLMLGRACKPAYCA